MTLRTLATTDDVAATLLRSLTAAEQTAVDNLIPKASAELRRIRPWIDDGMNAFDAIAAGDPPPPDIEPLDPAIVALVIARAIRPCVANPDGVSSESKSRGPVSRSRTFSSRGRMIGSDGELQFTEVNLRSIDNPPAVILGGTVPMACVERLLPQSPELTSYGTDDVYPGDTGWIASEG